MWRPRLIIKNLQPFFQSNCFNLLSSSKMTPNTTSMNLGAFAVTEQIGDGAFSHVLRAVRKSDSAHVILKCCYIEGLTPNMMMHLASEDGRPIPKEVFFLNKLRNVDGCVKMLDNFYDVSSGQYVIVLEDLTIQGYSKLTHELLQIDGFLNDYSISWILRELIYMLKQFHDLNVLHCDIKPDNIFIHREEKKVKLVDFNIAMELIPTEFPEVDPYLMGCTPEYTPPEVLIGKRLWTPASEVWSIGATAFVLLIKRFPFVDPYTCHRMQPAYPEEIGFGRDKGFTSNSRYSSSSSADTVCGMLRSYLSLKAKDFLLCCLHKRPECRPNFQHLLTHPFLYITPPRHRRISSESITSTELMNVSAKAS